MCNCSACTGASEFDVTREKLNRWTTALRSGEYLQAQGRLVRTGVTMEQKASYCCLGVYGVLNGGKISVDDLLVFERGEEMGGDSWALLIPGKLMSEEAQNFLSKLNDSFSMTFSQIADVIDGLPVSAFNGGDFWRGNWGAGFLKALTLFKFGERDD